MNDEVGLAIELWDNDGPMTTRGLVETLKVVASEAGLLLLPGDQQAMEVLRPGYATTATWYATLVSEVWFAQVRLKPSVALGDGTATLGETPLFGMPYSEMFGEAMLHTTKGGAA